MPNLNTLTKFFVHNGTLEFISNKKNIEFIDNLPGIRHWVYWPICSDCSPACASAEPVSAAGFEQLLGIQNVRTVDAATNMALRGAHFKQAGTPMWLFQAATWKRTQ